MKESLKNFLASNPAALDLSSLRYPKPTEPTSDQILENAQENLLPVSTRAITEAFPDR